MQSTASTSISPSSESISPFDSSSYSIHSEATSEEQPDLGAFATVIQAWSNLQPPLAHRVSASLASHRNQVSGPSATPSSLDTSTLSNPLNVNRFASLETVAEGESTVWSQRRIASYLSLRTPTITPTDADLEPSGGGGNPDRRAASMHQIHVEDDFEGTPGMKYFYTHPHSTPRSRLRTSPIVETTSQDDSYASTDRHSEIDSQSSMPIHINDRINYNTTHISESLRSLDINYHSNVSSHHGTSTSLSGTRSIYLSQPMHTTLPHTPNPEYENDGYGPIDTHVPVSEESTSASAFHEPDSLLPSTSGSDTQGEDDIPRVVEIQDTLSLSSASDFSVSDDEPDGGEDDGGNEDKDDADEQFLNPLHSRSMPNLALHNDTDTVSINDSLPAYQVDPKPNSYFSFAHAMSRRNSSHSNSLRYIDETQPSLGYLDAALSFIAAERAARLARVAGTKQPIHTMNANDELSVQDFYSRGEGTTSASEPRRKRKRKRGNREKDRAMDLAGIDPSSGYPLPTALSPRRPTVTNETPDASVANISFALPINVIDSHKITAGSPEERHTTPILSSSPLSSLNLGIQLPSFTFASLKREAKEANWTKGNIVTKGIAKETGAKAKGKLRERRNGNMVGNLTGSDEAPVPRILRRVKKPDDVDTPDPGARATVTSVGMIIKPAAIPIAGSNKDGRTSIAASSSDVDFSPSYFSSFMLTSDGFGLISRNGVDGDESEDDDEELEILKPPKKFVEKFASRKKTQFKTRSHPKDRTSLSLEPPHLRSLHYSRSSPLLRANQVPPSTQPQNQLRGRRHGHTRSNSLAHTSQPSRDVLPSRPSSFYGTSSEVSNVANSAVHDPRVARLRALADKLRVVFPEDKGHLDNIGLSKHEPGSHRNEDSGHVSQTTESGPFVDPRGPPPKDGDPLIHIFVDHSNILIGLLSFLKRHPHLIPSTSSVNPSDADTNSTPTQRRQITKHLSHAALALLLERGRPISKRVLVTSSPLYQPMESAERLGYEVRVFKRVPDDDISREGGGNTSTSNGSVGLSTDKDGRWKGKGHRKSGSTSTESDQAQNYGVVNTVPRNGTSIPNKYSRNLGAPGTSPTLSKLASILPFSGSSNAIQLQPRIRYREQGVDELLQLKLHQALAASDTAPSPNSTIVLATGDGNAGQFNEDGFLGPVRTALRKGWRVELYAWEEGLSRAWRREFGDGDGKELGGGDGKKAGRKGSGKRSKVGSEEDKSGGGEKDKGYGGRFRIVGMEQFGEELVELYGWDLGPGIGV